MDEKEQIKNAFTYHPPKNDQQHRYTCIRSKGMELAMYIAEFTPTSREQELALTKLEEAIMWANASIARNE